MSGKQKNADKIKEIFCVADVPRGKRKNRDRKIISMAKAKPDAMKPLEFSADIFAPKGRSVLRLLGFDAQGKLVVVTTKQLK